MTRDLRKDEPYLAYQDFDFNVCCAEAGDCFARYLVRMGEMRESIKIIHQAIENLPAGPVNVGDVRGLVHFSARRLIPRTNVGRKHGPVPFGSRVISARQGRGLFDDRGIDLAFRVGDDQPGLSAAVRRSILCHRGAERRVGVLSGRRRHAAGLSRPLPPAVVHPLRLFPHLIRGHTLSDVVAVLGSLNIIAAELDR